MVGGMITEHNPRDFQQEWWCTLALLGSRQARLRGNNMYILLSCKTLVGIIYYTKAAHINSCVKRQIEKENDIFFLKEN